jgi:hypothetical protein
MALAALGQAPDLPRVGSPDPGKLALATKLLHCGSIYAALQKFCCFSPS